MGWDIRSGARLLTVALAITLIVRSLILDGAYPPASAAALGGAFAGLAVLALIIASASDLRAAFNVNLVTGYGVALFVIYTVCTLIPLPAAIAHPIYRELGLSTGALSIAPYRAIEGLAALSAPLFAYIVGALAGPSVKSRDAAGFVLILGGLAFSMLSLSLYIGSITGDAPRLSAGIGANGACTTAAIFAVLGAADILRRRPDTTKGPKAPVKFGLLTPFITAPLGTTLLALSLIVALLTQSRAGLASTALGLLLVFNLGATGDGRRASLRPIGVLAGVIVFAGLAVAQLWLERLSKGVGQDYAGRAGLIALHWRAFLDNPWFGHGLNSFQEINAHYSTPEAWPETRFVGKAHNIYVQWLEETGVIGAALFALTIFQPLRRAIIGLATPSASKAWSAAAFSAVMICAVHGLVDFGLEILPIACLLALTLGLFAGAPNLETITDALDDDEDSD